MTTMETLSQAIERLTTAGYRDEFRAEQDGLRSVETGCVHAPETLVVDDIVRLEGVSDPQDESMLFALRCADHGTRGTYVVAFGPDVTPLDADMVRRLPDARKARAQARSDGDEKPSQPK
jgi:hypothetical protein